MQARAQHGNSRGRRFWPAAALVLLLMLCGQVLLGCDCTCESAASSHYDCGCAACVCCSLYLPGPVAVLVALRRGDESPVTGHVLASTLEVSLSIDHPPRS